MADDGTILVRVVAPHFVAGLIIENDACVRAAPILAWTLGRGTLYLRSYFRRKGWKSTIVKESHERQQPQA
jgi:hypothetical protein